MFDRYTRKKNQHSNDPLHLCPITFSVSPNDRLYGDPRNFHHNHVPANRKIPRTIMISESGDDQHFQTELLCKNIQSTDRIVRQKSLESLAEQSKRITITSDQAAALFDQCYLGVFKCYTDKFESCRNAAVAVISALLERLPSNDFYVDNIVPIIARRIGQTEIVEDSEEMRLSLIAQLAQIVRKFAWTDPTIDRLGKSYNNIMDIVSKTLRDPYPMVQRRTCEVVNALSSATASFSMRAEELANPLIAMLAHRQSPNRIAAIETLGLVALHTPSNGDVVVKIIVSVSPLLMDDIPYVRRECGRVGCRWLMELRDRYSFFERILPLVLCCLKDETAEIRNEINALWQKCGQQYFEENENELNKMELVDVRPKRYPVDVERPSLGCRAIVQRSLRVCSIVLREMGDWKDTIRLHSLKLLWHIVLNSEQALTAKFIEIYPVLARYCADEEKDVAAEAIRVAQLLGMLLDYKSWIDHGVQGLALTPHLGYLKCFAAMYVQADNVEKAADVPRIAKLLSSPTICHSLKADFQDTILSLTANLVDLHLARSSADRMNELVIDSMSATVEQLLYTIVVKVISMAEQNDGIPETGKEQLIKIATAPWELRSLHARYLPDLLRTLEDLDSENSDQSEPIILVYGIIWLCGYQPEYLTEMTDAIRLVMDNATPNGKIKIFSAISVAMLNWSASMALPVAESTNSLRDFVKSIVEPPLIWRAGRSAESLRAMATGVLCSMSQGATAETAIIFVEIAPHFTQLIEDNNVVTRAYALRCVMTLEALTIDKLRPLSLGVLGRLDDPSAEVREYAVKCLAHLQLQASNEHEHDSWEAVLKHILSTMLLHLDSAELKLRTTVIESIITIGKQHRSVLKPLIEALPITFGHPAELEAIRSGAFHQEI